jgi:DNA-binding transcriptional LysR family regulator
VAPTPLAHQLIGPIRQALRQVQGTLTGTVAFDPIASDRTFKISIGEIQATSMLPVLIDALRLEAPNVKVRAFQTNRREIKDALALGSLDLAVDIPRLSSHALKQHQLTRGENVCVLRKGHPRSRGAMTLEKFQSLDFIAVSSRPTGSSLLELALSRVGMRLEPVLRTQYYLPAMRIVESSDYALVAPRALAEQFDVIGKPLPFEIGMEGSWLYWHRGAEEDPANLWLRSLVIRQWGTGSTHSDAAYS